MPICSYKYCKNESVSGQQYCRAHAGGQQNRRGPGIVPDAKSVLNQPSNANFGTVQTWCADAKTEVENFLGNRVKADTWISHFFGGQNVLTCKNIMSKMPSILDAWHDGTKNIMLIPVYDKTNTPNSVNSTTGVLNVSPGFLNGGNDNKWVLVHESSHGVKSIDNTLDEIVDLRYEADDGFSDLSPGDRLHNADHFRCCIEQAKTSTLKKCVRFGVHEEDDPVAAVSSSRKISHNRGYAYYVKKGTADLFQLVWLQLFTLITQGPEYFKGNQNMPTWYKNWLKPALPGKSSSKFKNKDFVRLEDLYGKSRSWINSTGSANCGDNYDERVRGLEQISIEKQDADVQFIITSYFTLNQVVDDQALVRGVRQFVELIVREHPYVNLDGSDVIKLAQAAQKARKQPGRDWILQVQA